MSVRVNLLPQEAAARQAASRQRNLVIAGVTVLVAGLGAATVWQDGNIADAEVLLAGEQEFLTSLQAEELRLGEFAELAAESDETRAALVAALAGEASVAGILQDVAAVMPSDAEFESLIVTLAEGADEPGQTASSLGTLVASGRSANAHAPGVERLLLEFDKVAGFHDPFLTNSALGGEDDPYPSFNFQTQLGPEVLTGRYADGLPEELR